jgi:hypothetical protein
MGVFMELPGGTGPARGGDNDRGVNGRYDKPQMDMGVSCRRGQSAGNIARAVNARKNASGCAE